MRTTSLLVPTMLSLATALAMPVAVSRAQPPQLDKATLTANITSTTCTITTPVGSTTVSCNAASWAPTL